MERLLKEQDSKIYRGSFPEVSDKSTSWCDNPDPVTIVLVLDWKVYEKRLKEDEWYSFLIHSVKEELEEMKENILLSVNA